MSGRSWPCWTAPWPSGTCSGASIPATSPTCSSQNASSPPWPACGLRPPTGARWPWPPTPPGPAPPRWPAPSASCSASRATATATASAALAGQNSRPVPRGGRLRRPRVVRAAAGTGAPFAPVPLQPPGGALRPGIGHRPGVEPLLLSQRRHSGQVQPRRSVSPAATMPEAAAPNARKITHKKSQAPTVHRRLAHVRHRLGRFMAGNPNAVGGPVGNSACFQGGSNCGKRIRPRQRHSPGRPCHPAIYGSA